MATIYDVARDAGVSPKTVSRVINGDSAVRKSTKEKVDKAISQLGYVPSTAARAMRSNKSGLFGLITGAISLSPDRPQASGLNRLNRSGVSQPHGERVVPNIFAPNRLVECNPKTNAKSKTNNQHHRPKQIEQLAS